MIRATKTAVAALAVAALALAGCGSSADSAAHETVTVFAAASLNKTFTELGALYEQQHPGATVTFNFAGSNSLLEQMSNGADADVFASADQRTMDKAVAAGLIDGAPTVFTSNVLTIVTPPGNPAGITSFADLATPSLSLVVCAPQVPCGTATDTIAESTGTTLTPVSEESSVTDVLGKITTGQADAGLVYVTDAASAGDKVQVINFPESDGAVNEYPIARVQDSANPDGAARFIDLVTSVQGQQVLHDAGFQ
ncbi:molybdate ABC transporter substrate-binding protein [Tomitella biformata]|uniref:molybdate ABC transporter substrate-binding protein n=1 Tax=Tomitella biformata TaxID=630403 RepID=UPI0004635D61|nr:molybdate ABC transporter substrate-binding protein [Tomitella biformata]